MRTALAAVPEAEGSIEQQTLKFIEEAKEDRLTHEPWHRDVYRFCLPWRRRPGYWKQVNDQDELFDSTAIGALNDFSSDMATMFTPDDDPWLIVETAAGVAASDAAQMKPQLQAYTQTVFDEIARSNFQEASRDAYKDLGAGTMGMCIQDLGDLTAPIHCQAIPITDMLMVRGVYGGVDFRAREVPAMKLRDIQPTYRHARLTEEMLARIRKDPAGTVCVRECWWRIWGGSGRYRLPRWQYVLLVDDKAVADGEFTRDGCCAVIPARWDTDPTTAWGVGPLYVVLPTIKTLDQLGYLVLKQLSMAVDPPGFYDNDSVINLENGLFPGQWVPRAPGSKVDPLKLEGDFDTSFYSRSGMQNDIKRALFQDGPVQTGDTPPTLGQWNDQKAEMARRMGVPFGRITTEWQVAIFQRFAYLLERRGNIPKLTIKSARLRVRALSPIVKAQRQQKVLAALQLLQSGVAVFGDQMQMIVDGAATFRKMQEIAGDNILQVRDDAAIQALMQQATEAAQQTGAVPAPQPSVWGTPNQ